MVSAEPRPAYHYVKAILWKPAGMEVGPDEPGEATAVDPLILLLRRKTNHYRPQDDGDLPGGGVLVEMREPPEAALRREVTTETGLACHDIGHPVLVWANAIDDRRGNTAVNVVHSVYVAQVAPDAEVPPEVFDRPEADNHRADWLLLSRAIGETSIASLRDAMQWTYDRGLWLAALPPAVQ